MTPADKVAVFPSEDLDQLLDLARFVEGHTEPGLLASKYTSRPSKLQAVDL
jgi:hypothetical protein